MAVVTDTGGADVAGALSGGRRSVVAAGTRLCHAAVIETRRAPGDGGVAVVARVLGLHMISRHFRRRKRRLLTMTSTALLRGALEHPSQVAVLAGSLLVGSDQRKARGKMIEVSGTIGCGREGAEGH